MEEYANKGLEQPSPGLVTRISESEHPVSLTWTLQESIMSYNNINRVVL